MAGCEPEELAHSGGDIVGVAVSRPLAQAHRGLVQEFLHKRTGQMLQLGCRLGIGLSQPAERPLDLLLANLLRLNPQSCQQRLDLELPVSAREACNLLLHDRLDVGNLCQPRSQCAVEPSAEIVDIEEPHAFDVCDGALHIRRYGEIDEHERPFGTVLDRAANEVGAEHRILGAGRGDGEVRPRERFLELVEPVGRAAEPRSSLDRVLARPVRNGDVLHAAAGGGLECLEPDASGSDDECAACAKVAEHAVGKR